MVFGLSRQFALRRAVVLLLALILVWGGCGYRLAAAGPDTVAVRVETLTNDSIEPGIGLTLAAALRRETERTTGLRLVEKSSTPAYTVSGRVRSVDTFGRTFTPGILAIEYTVTIQLDVILTGPGQERFSVDSFAQRASEIYLASADLQISQKNREEALRRVSMLLADRLLAQIQRIVAARVGDFAQPPEPRHQGVLG